MKHETLSYSRFFPAVFLTLLLVLHSPVLEAADLLVPSLEIITRGIYNEESSSVELTSRGVIDISASGGYKFGGNLGFGFNSEDLGHEVDTELLFRNAEVTVRGLFNSSANLTYFVGETDSFATGDDFPRLFGTRLISSHFRGYLYFPDNNTMYSGIHRVNGTGIKLESSFGTPWNRSIVYLYQESAYGKDGDNPPAKGVFSADARSLFSFESVNIETFIGGTFPVSAFGLYRAGLLFHYSPPGERGDFFAQIGIPYWNPSNSFDIGLFYFLFEPRISFGPLSIITTLFWHPEYYLFEDTGQLGRADININLMIGKLYENVVTGGIQSRFSINTSEAANFSDSFTITATPYLNLATAGVIWNMMVNVQLVPFKLSNMFEGVIGIKAEF